MENLILTKESTSEEQEQLYSQAQNIYYHSTDRDKLLNASRIFHDLGDYKKSEFYADKCDTLIEYSVGNTVTFGCFEGNPIEWTVLEANGKIRLLFAKHIITRKAFHEERLNTNWSLCTLRKWLNHDFLNESFTLAERMSIFATRRDNPSNRDWATHCGPQTMDKVFLFNHDEIDQYFPNPADRIADGWWWTRTLGHCLLSAESVYTDGSIYTIGLNIADNEVGVRPAMWVMLR